MKKPTPQQETILSHLRDKDWHCGSEWLNGIKDDRIRISELNRGYMKDRGYFIDGKPCKGSACGKDKCPLYMRKALPLVEKEEPKYGVQVVDGKVYKVLVN